MGKKIFGPILLVLEYGSFEEAITWVNQHSKPLALYLFSRDQQKQKHILHSIFSVKVCFNDTVVRRLKFGSFPLAVSEKVGGMGSYHGKASFDTFSHERNVLRKSF
jgi:acyl-CoA reductase-like NAD-dependent aldehyde dehydrogenase